MLPRVECGLYHSIGVGGSLTVYPQISADNIIGINTN